MKYLKLIIILSSFFNIVYAQPVIVDDGYLKVDARHDDPLYTTYAATIERSRLYGDKAYKMVYYDQGAPLYYESDKAGRTYNLWMVNDVAVMKTGEYFKPPVVEYSFPDMAIMKHSPMKGIEVQETFFVYSSKISLVNLFIENVSDRTLEVTLFPIFDLGNDSLSIKSFDTNTNSYITHRYETHNRLISDLYKNAPYPYYYDEIWSTSQPVYSYGGYHGSRQDFYEIIKTDYYSEDKYNDTLNLKEEGSVDFISLHQKFDLKPGETKSIRYIRGVQGENEDIGTLKKDVERVKDLDLQTFVDENVALFKSIPRIDISNRQKMIYLGALNLARGCMLPPSGETSHNFYVFSRNPLWGWGHGHQVLHESLSMIPYVYLDPESAQGSQRVYMEQQGDDGLIAYRHGPRGPQTYPHKGEPTTSAPFYSWINWELYAVSQDKKFLEDAYESGSKYVDWLYENRDDDKDGTFEWGPYGIIENVRDWYNAVFQVSAERYLDVDKEDISDELECLDLSLMVCNEINYLRKMAEELGNKKEARTWEKKSKKLAELINERMWHEESQFYYNINAKDHSFYFMERDLKRQEIIGFLPLWAEVATPERAEKIIRHLTDTTKFWRTFGVPTLAADDSWYSPDVDYCCKWNGPVWLLWNYMVYDGLRKYGYNELADQLADKMLKVVDVQLSKNHNFWESFSPDNTVLNSPSNYIWDAIIAKVLIDKHQVKQ